MGEVNKSVPDGSDEAYLLATVRYVERNPVTARLCREPFDWPWSSATVHLLGKDDGLVKVKPMLDRIDDWRAYLLDAPAHYDDQELIQRHTRTGRPVGTTDFITHIEAITGKSLKPKKAGRRPARNSK